MRRQREGRLSSCLRWVRRGNVPKFCSLRQAGQEMQCISSLHAWNDFMCVWWEAKQRQLFLFIRCAREEREQAWQGGEGWWDSPPPTSSNCLRKHERSESESPECPKQVPAQSTSQMSQATGMGKGPTRCPVLSVIVLPCSENVHPSLQR